MKRSPLAPGRLVLVPMLLVAACSPSVCSARRRSGLELLARGAVDVQPLITFHLPLRDFAEARATFVERRDGAIRVMLHP